MSDSDLLPPGTVLAERYEIVSLLGRGGMSAVYRARDRRLATAVWAVKEMGVDHLDGDDLEQAGRLFEQEAIMLAALSHRTLPRVCDYFIEGGRRYLVMELLEGETLERRVEQSGPVDPSRALQWCVELAEALVYLHGRSPAVIFRDMKPSNVMLTTDGDIKLIDFGIARFHSAEKAADTVALGTPGYAAPEQYGARQSDGRVDVYGLGATLHYLLTARAPTDHMFVFPPPSSICGGLPPAVDAVVLRAVSVNPADRFSDMAEMGAALREALDSVAGRSAPPLAQRPAMPPSPEPHAPVHTQKMALAFAPAALDFGTLRQGETRRLEVRVTGGARGALSCPERRMVRVEPRFLERADATVEVTVYTSSLREGGTHRTEIFLRSPAGEVRLPVCVSIEPARLSLLGVILAALLAVASLIPVFGFVAALLLAVLYYACPSDERIALRVFAVAAACCCGLNLALIAFLLARGHHLSRWFPWMNLFTVPLH